MRRSALIAAMLVFATAAGAEPAPRPLENVTGVPLQIADPRTVDRLADSLQAVSKALLDLPVGDLKAAAEGRAATPADHRRTLRSETGMNEAQLRARIAAAKPVIEQSVRALNDALPAITQALAQAQQSIDRAAANMPDPNYPKR